MLIAGVDEAGRGPLAGPVTVAAVILKDIIDGLDDSKKLNEKMRNRLAFQIRQSALAWAVVHISVDEIDRINILQATLKGMQQSVENLSLKPDQILVDGNTLPNFTIEAQAIVGGDGKVPVISAASILAKTARDELMQKIDKQYPQYGFGKHKGYGTRFHIEALKRNGPCEHHRKSFGPVRNLLQQESG